MDYGVRFGVGLLMWCFVVMMRGHSVANGGADSYGDAMAWAYRYVTTWKQVDYVDVFYSKWSA